MIPNEHRQGGRRVQTNTGGSRDTYLGRAHTPVDQHLILPLIDLISLFASWPARTFLSCPSAALFGSARNVNTSPVRTYVPPSSLCIQMNLPPLTPRCRKHQGTPRASRTSQTPSSSPRPWARARCSARSQRPWPSIHSGRDGPIRSRGRAATTAGSGESKFVPPSARWLVRKRACMQANQRGGGGGNTTVQ